MQLTNSLCVLILAVTVSSAALPIAEPVAVAEAAAEPWNWNCGHLGQPCGKAKRAAEAIAEPVAVAEAVAEPWNWHCGHLGQPCGKVKRAAEAFAEALAELNAEPAVDSINARHAIKLTRDLANIVSETQDDPEAYFASLGLPEDSDIDKREAAPEPWNWHCGHLGQPCGKLRRAAEAIAEAVAVADPNAEPWNWHCGHLGQPCGKSKRDELALAHAADMVLRAI